MFLVEQPTLFNAQCLITRRADLKHGPYVDLGRDFEVDHRGRMYVSATAVRSMAGLLDEPTRQQVADLEERAESLEAALKAAEDELESLREFERSAEYTLAHYGTKVRKKPGRKPEPKEPANAAA